MAASHIGCGGNFEDDSYIIEELCRYVKADATRVRESRDRELLQFILDIWWERIGGVKRGYDVPVK